MMGDRDSTRTGTGTGSAEARPVPGVGQEEGNGRLERQGARTEVGLLHMSAHKMLKLSRHGEWAGPDTQDAGASAASTLSCSYGAEEQAWLWRTEVVASIATICTLTLQSHKGGASPARQQATVCGPSAEIPTPPQTCREPRASHAVSETVSLYGKHELGLPLSALTLTA